MHSTMTARGCLRACHLATASLLSNDTRRTGGGLPAGFLLRALKLPKSMVGGRCRSSVVALQQAEPAFQVVHERDLDVLALQAVDALSAVGSSGAGAAVQAAVSALVVSGVCRGVSGLAKELQHPAFTPVSQVCVL